MIYIFTALYCEAQMFIEQYHLKKRIESNCFQQFYNKEAEVLLTVSGAGEVCAAAAVGSVCTKDRPGQSDFLLNIGICGGSSGKEGVFLANKLTEQATGKTFYPDMLYRHCFQEAGILTGMTMWKAGEWELSGETVRRHSGEQEMSERRNQNGMLQADLYDMEAAAVYQAGAYFFAPHQMMFLKIISDHGEGRKLSAEDVRQCMEPYKDGIVLFLEQLKGAGRGSFYEDSARRERDEAVEEWCRKLGADMHCSKTMEHTLRQYLRYAVLTEAEEVIEGMYREHRLPCKDKREGKRCFEILKQRLL